MTEQHTGRLSATKGLVPSRFVQCPFVRPVWGVVLRIYDEQNSRFFAYGPNGDVGCRHEVKRFLL